MEGGTIIKQVLNFEGNDYNRVAIDLWRRSGYSYKSVNLNDFDFSEKYPDVEILIVRLRNYISKKMLEVFPNLEYLVSATTGLDHIDQEYCTQVGVKIFSLRPYIDFIAKIPSTAELTFGLILSLVRNIPSAVASVEKKEWDRDRFRGIQLYGKTIGIIGLGRTGYKLAKYSDAFGMKVYYYDPYVLASEFCKSSSIEFLLENSDFVSVHVHLSPETTNILNKETLNNLRPGAYLINTSRARVWDEHALAAMLKVGRIAGIATDVLSTEYSLIENNPLWQAMSDGYNVIITPHIGGATFDAMQKTELFLAEKVLEEISSKN